MHKKIKIAVVDDDPSMLDILSDFYQESELVEIKYKFTDSRKFLRQAPTLDFDLSFLDINIPYIDGLVVAQLSKKKPFIFITGSEDKLKDALGLEPIDVITKPFSKERLDHAIEKAFKLIGNKIEYVLFNVAESKRKIKIHLNDILFVGTDDTDPRHKSIILKDSAKYTLMDCSLGEILAMTSHLVQINRRELVALDIIDEMAYDVISLRNNEAKGIPKELTLGYAYKEEMSKKVFYK
jgi:DNA-binding LytR/AlgR family response regulator